MSSDLSARSVLARVFRGALPWALALAVATCTNDTTGPSKGGVGYFAFRPVYSGVSSSLSQFGIVADSVHVLLTRPVDQVVLDTTVFFPPDSLELRMALPVELEQSPETLTAMIEIKAGGVVLFVDTLDVQVIDGPPNLANIPTATLDYVGPGNDIKSITVFPADTTIFFGDTLFYTSTAVDSSDAAVASYYVAWKTSDTTVAKVNAQGRLIAPNVRGTLQVIGRTPTGVADTGDITFAPVPSQILADSGVAQSAQAGDSLATLFVAQVRAADNLPVEGIHVRFAAVTAGGAVRDSILVTDVNGRVRTRGVLGTGTGAYSYSATVVGTAISTTFSGTASAGAPTAIAISAGNAQVDSAGRALPVSFAVRVADAFNNPINGVKVYWNRTVGTGTLALDSSLTNGTGIASTGYTLGAVGVDSVTATIAGTSAFVGFQATAISGAPASIAKNFGDAQTDTVGRALTDSLVVVVKSATNKPVVGSPVVWTILRGGSTSNDTIFTDAAGRAAVAYTLGTVNGTDSVRAKAGAINATFTATALTGAATTLSIVSGNAQTDTTGYALPLPFVVHAVDTFGNSVAATNVLFVRTAGTGTLADDTVATDSIGNASVGYTLGTLGTDSVTATLLCGCSTVSFTATAISALPASIVTVQGDSQTVTVNTIADTFAVLVRDGANNPVAGARVDWSFIPAVGAFTPILPAASLSSFTDSLGVARGIYTAGTNAGPVRVEAQVGSHIDSIFVTAVAAAPSAIAIVSGNGQADTVGRAIPLPFVIKVTDAFGNPVSGAQVAFTRTFGSGTLFGDTLTTNASGQVAVGYLFGLVPGVDTIRVDLVGTSAFVDFNATAIAAAPASIATHGGDGQTSAVTTSLTDSLEVEVRSGDDDPIVNGAVVWTVVGGGLTLSADTTFTDLLGHTFVHVIADTVAGSFTVQAQAVGLGSPTTFTVNVLPGAPAILTYLSGRPQTDTIGSLLPLPFVVRATDAYNNSVENALVVWAVDAGTGILSADSSYTDFSGMTSVNYVLGPTPGTDTISATLECGCSTVGFFVTGIMATPASIQIDAGDGQSAPVGTALAQPLVATVLDGASIPMVSAQVVWTILRGGSVVTDTVYSDASGKVTSNYTVGTLTGIDSIEVRALNGGVSAIFTANATAGAPATIFMISGDAQSDTAGKTLPLPLVVAVQDEFNNGVPNAQVAFTRIAGSGALLADTVLTDGAGHAAVGYTLGYIAGVDTIRAELVATGGIVDFTATTLPGAPASLITASGHGQVDTVARTLPGSLVARVYNAGSVPISGVAVVWTVLRGGSIDVDTTLSDSLGFVVGHYTLGTASGIDSIEVKTVVGGITAIFEETAVSEVPAAIAVVSGNAQTDSAGTSLVTPLIVRVTDGYNNPVAGVAVTFTLTAGDGYVLPDTAHTNANGLASGSLTLGNTPGASTVRAALVGTSAFVDFGATGLPRSASALSPISGNGQMDTVARILPESLVAQVYGPGATPAVGIPLVWTVLRGGSVDVDTTVSDVNGKVVAHYTLGTLAGFDSVEVRTLDGTQVAVFEFVVVNAAASSIAIVSGDGQSDTSGHSIALPFVARVTDLYGNPVAGERVAFTRIAGSGTLFADTLTTNAAGQVSVGYQFGTVPGIDSIRATHVATGSHVDFTATTIAGLPNALSFLGGFGQSDTVAQTLAESLLVFVNDIDGRPLGGIPVVWTSRHGAILSADTTVTDSTGRTWVFVTLATVAGKDTIDAATIDGALSAFIRVIALPDAPSVVALVSGDAQADTAGRNLPAQFFAQVTDAFGNPIINATVVWSVTAGGGILAGPDTVNTDGNGLTARLLQLGSVPGINSVHVALLGTSAYLDFTATGVNPEALGVVAHAGSGQTDTVGFTLTDSLKVQVFDIYSIPIIAAPVVWSVTRGGVVAAETTYTDSLGYTTNAYTLGTVAGEDSVEARVVGSAPVALFTANALAGTGSAIAIESGNAQTDTIGLTLPLPLIVRVTDTYGNGSPFQTVIFTIQSGTGTLITDTAQTDMDGHAVTQYVLGAQLATDTIRASLAGGTPYVDFTETAVAGVPTQFQAISGNGQVDSVLATLTDSLVAELRDASDAPVPGTWVYWTTAGLTLSADSSLTDVNGRVAVQATFDSVAAGNVQVLARNADTTLTATFSLTVLPGQATQLTLVSGDGQTGVVGTTLPGEFITLVQDAHGNGAPGAQVAFTVGAANGTVSPDTAYSDSLGFAKTTYILNAIIGTDSITAQLVGTGASVLFTATGTAGVPTQLDYIAGTGQADTVGRTLGSEFTIVLKDVNHNPVEGAWIHWTRTSATGVLAADSTLTAANGVASVGYTLGTVAGIDSVSASFGGLADVVFYAQAINGIATSITLAGGAGQSGAIDSVLADRFTVLVSDTFGNGVPGIPVNFGTYLGGGSFDGSETFTDSVGIATSGAVYLGGTPGAVEFIATSLLFPGDTIHFAAVALPVGATKQWVGAVSSTWSDPANWAPAFTPGLSDTVFIHAGNAHDPVLDATTAIGKLIVQGTVTIDLGGDLLTVLHDVDAPQATFTATTGSIQVASGSWNGTATNLGLSGGTLIGATSLINGDLSVGTGGMDLNGHSLVVNGSVNLNGPLIMSSASDTLEVWGAIVADYTDLNGYTAAGVIIAHGDFTASSLFRPTGTNRVVFAGSAPQTASFSDPSSSWFQDLVLDNAAGVTFTSSLWALGSVTQNAGHIAGSTVTVAGGLSTSADSAWAFGTTIFSGTTAVMPDTLFGTVAFEFTAPVSLAQSTRIEGALYVSGAGSIDLNSTHLSVAGELQQNGALAGIVMDDAADTLEVGGMLSVSQGNTLAAGTLILHGGLDQNGPGSGFQGAPAFTTIFEGTSGQGISFTSAGLGAGQARFGAVVIADSVALSSNAWFTGDVTIQSGGKVTAQDANLGGDLVGATWDNWRPSATNFAAAPTTLPDSLYGNARFDDSVTLSKPFTVGGDLQLAGPTELAMNGSPMKVGGDLNVPSGTLRMENEGDSLDVAGQINWGTANSSSLTNGVIVARHAVMVTTGSSAFQPSGAHRTVFDWTDEQPVFVNTGNYFNHLEFRGAGPVRLLQALPVQGSLTESSASPIQVISDYSLPIVATGPVALDGVVFDSVPLVINSSSVPSLNDLAFSGISTGTSLSLTIPGAETPIQYSGLQFVSPKEAGFFFVHAEDNASDGLQLELLLVNSTPLSATGFTDAVGASGDGASVIWSRLAFSAQPTDVVAGDSLAPVRVAVLSPLGDTLTGYTGTVSLLIGSNPNGGTLSGTTSVAAVGGVATFDDLSIDNAGSNYSLVATAPGLEQWTSDDFDVTTPLPVGFATQWTGGYDNSWTNPGNWSTGVVPDSTTNVFISGIAANTPYIGTGYATVNRLRMGAAAELYIAEGAVLTADSSVESGNSISGGGTLYLAGNGTITGPVSSHAFVTGTYAVAGHTSFGFNLDVSGDLALTGADTLHVGGQLGTISGTGRLIMTHPEAFVDVEGPASFGGGSTSGQLSAGTLRVSYGLIAEGPNNDAFAPEPGHLTILNGTADQQVTFAVADTGAYGSHFGALQVSTNGLAIMRSPAWVTGNLLVTSGATLADSFNAGVAVQGLTSLDPGATIAVSRLALEGTLSPAAGSTYAVPLTVYFGGGSGAGIYAATYDTLQISKDAQAAEDLLITGDLRIVDEGQSAGRFDVNGWNVVVSGDVNINGDGALIMQNAADSLLVTGSFFTNGASTDGLLTAGWLRIGGNFRQAADGSGESFRADPGHTTEFYYGGPTTRTIAFDSPSGAPGSNNGSHFGNLLMPIGTDSIEGRVVAAGPMFVAAALAQDTAYPSNMLVGYDSVTISNASPGIQLRTLEVWGGLRVDNGVSFVVANTRLMGGPDALVPALAYQNLLIANKSDTLGGDLTITGSLDLGIYCSEVCTSTGGDLTVAGHTLLIGQDLSVMGLGQLNMAAGDSVDVGGANTWRTEANDGRLTGGTLVVRGLFNTVSTSTFQASPAHRTVLAAPGIADIYPTGDMRFGSLVLLDGAPRRIRNTYPIIVQDSLILGSSTSGLTDTLGFSTGAIIAQGPVFAVAGSEFLMEGTIRFDDDSIKIFGSYSAGGTGFNGVTQPIPDLPYSYVNVTGTAFLTADMDLPTGANLSVFSGGLDLAGHTLHADEVYTYGDGTLTMANAADTVEIRNIIVMGGGNESGHLTAGVMRVSGAFHQEGSGNDSSFYATGTHTVEFVDSIAPVQVYANRMDDGRSRFNAVIINGKGAHFNQTVRMKDAAVSAGVDSVSGEFARIDGPLSDPGHLWLVDTTYLAGVSESFPDSMPRNVWLLTNALTSNKYVGGALTTFGSLLLGGHTVRVGGDFATEVNGRVLMTQGVDSLVVGGLATFNGATEVGFLTNGHLVLNGPGMSRPGNADAFDASQSHITVFNGGSNQSADFTGGAQGYGFNDIEIRNANLSFGYGALAHGSIKDSIGATINITAGDSTLETGSIHLLDAVLTDVRLVTGDTLLLGNITFNFTDPESKTQLTIKGAGRNGYVDLSGVYFNNIPSSGQLLAVVDTLGGPDSLNVRVFGSVPFDGSTLTSVAGNASAAWSRLAMTSTLPATLDSLVPFDIDMTVIEPDGQNRYDVIGSVSIALVNGGGATLNGPTTATFDGSLAHFTGLTLDNVLTGGSFHFEMQGRAIDSLNTLPFDIINPAPAGAVAFTGLSSTDWTDGSNWSTDSVPAATETVFIPGGKTVLLPPSSTYTVNDLVLGLGAHLDLGSGSTLTVNGNAYAGQTITGPGTIDIAGGASQISGTFPSLHVSGSASAVGRTSIAGDLIIDGGSAEFNVGGQFVDVSNTLYTQNGGLLTMDGADTLYVSSVNFAGGDETGRLTDGILLIQGGNFDQGSGDPKSFYATGNHTTIFGNGGGETSVNINDPYTAQFANVKVQNPNGVNFNESGLGLVVLSGDVTLSAGGTVTSDTLKIDGTLTVGGTESISANELDLGLAPNITGNYGVGHTVYFGSTIVVPAVPGGYQDLTLATEASLAGPVVADRVFVTVNDLTLNGNTLHAQSFTTQGLGRLVMNNYLDTLIVDQLATFGGATEVGQLTDGAVILAGNLNGASSKYLASGNHLTRFVGANDTAFTSPFVICEGPCFPPHTGIWFGRLEVENANLVSSEPTGGGLHVENSALLTNSTLGDGTGSLFVQGDLTVDATSTIQTADLSIGQRIFLADGANFSVGTTFYPGPDSHILAAPYQNLVVLGGATLDTAVTADYVTLQGTGALTMAGHTLTVGTDFVSKDQSHLVMNDPNDSLLVGADAVFKADSTEGDFTAGSIMARYLLVPTSTSGGHLGFVQTGDNRYIPMANDTIEMFYPGPAESRLKSIDFSSAAGPVEVIGLWVTDTIRIDSAATSVTSYYEFVAGKAFIQTAGSVTAPRLAVQEKLEYAAGTYVVDTTVFAGAGQTIDSNVPYRNLVVQYGALLGGNLDLRSGGYNVLVENIGQLDLGGHTLEASEFRTTGFGQLKMTDPADELVAASVVFDGDSTDGLLTAGVIRTPHLQQGATTSPKSYAPSGTHRLMLDDLGIDLSDVYAQFATPGTTAGGGSHANTLVTTFYQTGMYSNIVVMDTLLIDTQINDESGHTIEVYGPAIIGPEASVQLDSLIVHDTLIVDGAAILNIDNIVFAAGAGAMPVLGGYDNVYIEGDQTLTAPFSIGGSLYIRGGGTLTPDSNTVTINSNLFVQDNARLIMANTADTLDAATANFHGAASNTDLATGILRIRNGFSVGSGLTSASFTPTGMVTEFYGGGTANISFDAAGPATQYFDTLRVIEGTTISPQGNFLVMGPAVLQDGSTFDGNSSTSALDFRKGLSVLDTSIVNSGGSATIFFEDSLTVATPANYSVSNTRFGGTKGIPDLPYQYLIIDSVQMTLDHPLSASSQMIITGGTPGATQIQLGGHTITAGDFDVSGYARIVMADPIDSVVSNGYVSFAGEDETGLLSAGTIRVGGDLTQNGYYSPKSLAALGTKVELYGAVTHTVNFDTPSTTQSYLGLLSIIDGGTADVRSNIVIQQGLDLDPTSSFRLTTNPGLTADIFGTVNFGTGTTFTTDAAGGKVNFYGTVNPGAGMSYSVETTSYTNTNSLADVQYTNLFLADGTFDTLTTTLNVTGELGISGTGPGAQALVLNGNTINAGRLTTSFLGQFTMHNSTDLLAVSGSAIFDGGDLSGLLTQGTITIGDSLTQFASWSDKSFRSTGTTVQFLDLGHAHEISFNTPDSSYFADVSGISPSPLELNITGVMKATGTVSAYDMTITGDTLEVGVLSMSPNPGSVTLKKLIAGQIIGSFNTFDVGTVQFNGSGVIPSIAYDTLILAGKDSVMSGSVFAQQISIHDSAYIASGATLQSNGDLVINGPGASLTNDGGVVSVGATLTTINGGVLISQNVANTMDTKHAVWNGGDETGLLTLGALSVSGDFSILSAAQTFRADSLFTVNFAGAVAHDLNIDVIAPVQYFGGLGISGAGASLNLTYAGELQVYKLSATGGAMINGSGNPIQAERVAVNGLVLNQTVMHVLANSDQPEQFDGVTFTGFGSSDIQLFFEHPNHSGSFTFNGVNFDNVTVVPGAWVATNRLGGSGSFTLNVGAGANFGLGAALTILGPNTTVNWAGGF